MTNYVVTVYADKEFDVPAGGVNTDTSLTLIGRGASGYGQIIAENTIKQLSNFAGATAPTTSKALKGQLWYDSGNGVLNFYNGSAWYPLAKSADLSAYAPLGAFNTVQSNVNTLLNTAALKTDLNAYVTKAQLTNPPNGTAPITIAAGGTGISTIGTSGQVLVVNSAGTGLQYVSPASLVSGDTSVMHTNVTNTPTLDNNFNLGSSSLRYANVYAATFQGTATSANYADLAERYEVEGTVEAGDVVILGGSNEITKCTDAFSTDVFGVISTAPAYMMNSDAGNDATHPYVALAGRVPVKVVGPVKKGQRLVSSGKPGVAQAVDLSQIENSFVVIGRALADKTTDDIGLVEITVGAK